MIMQLLVRLIVTHTAPQISSEPLCEDLPVIDGRAFQELVDSPPVLLVIVLLG